MAVKNNRYFDNLIVQCMSVGQNDMQETFVSDDLCKVVDDAGTLLHYAVARESDSSIISTLVKLGCEIDALDSLGRTALMIAVENQDVDTVDSLMSANASVDIAGPNCMSALQMIFDSQYGNRYIHETLLLAVQSRSSSTQELVDTLYNAGCLTCHAVFCKNPQVIEGLLKRGVDVNATSCDKRTALHIAASRNDFELVKLLVQNGANVNAVDGKGNSALLSAASLGNVGMLTFLLDEGADINIEQPSTGWTALSLVFEFSSSKTEQQHITCAEILIQRGAVPRNASILDAANGKSYSYKSKLLIAHLAMKDALGVPIIESLTGSTIDDYRLNYPEFGHFHDMCQNLLNTAVFKSVTLLDLLTETDSRMLTHVRNGNFLPSLEQFYSEHHLSVRYQLFFKMLDERVSKAVQRMELQNKSIDILCHIINANCYIVARKVVGYLSNNDLERLSCITNE